MAEVSGVPIDNLSLRILPPGELDIYEWAALQALHLESLAAQPGVDRDRAKHIVTSGKPYEYRATRIDPDILVQRGDWTDGQVFRDILVAALYDGNDVIAGAITQDNTSPRTPKMLGRPIRKLEAQTKMLIRPGLPIPFLGNRRNVHFREGFTHPDVSTSLALIALWHSLARRFPRQPFTTYLYPGDPADAEMVEISDQLDLLPTGTTKKQLQGYKSDQLVRVGGKTRDVMDKIFKLPDMEEAVILIDVE